MSMSSDETLPTQTDRITDAILSFVDCIADSLEGICSYGWTIGDSYVPFNPDPDSGCDEDEVACSQMWVRVMSVQPAAGSGLGWGGDCGVTLAMELEVGVLRCVEIPDDGEAPTESDVLLAAIQATEDMNSVFCSAMGCEVWETIQVGSWSPQGPMGAQYGGVWTFTVEL